jgi:hypothetical protein
MPISHGLEWPQVFECFLVYCVEDAHVKLIPDTADQYVSHVLKHVEHKVGDYDIRTTARSALYQAVHAAFERDHKAKMPLRLTARIPFTVPFILWSFSYIDQHFESEAMCRLLKAAMAAGHAFSLRPGEYLLSSHRYETERYLRGVTTFGWFEGVPYPATEGWPEGYPTHITSMLDYRKNAQGQGGPVGVAANPSTNLDELCCVRVLTDYIRRAAIKADDPLFVTSEGKHLGTDEISTVMKTCAEHHDVDSKRVVPACMRKNVITQMTLNTPQLQRQLQGGWRSRAGEEHYWAQLLQVADANQSAVHQAGSATIAVIQNIFGASGRVAEGGA